MKVTLSAKEICVEEKDLLENGMKVRLSDCLYCQNQFYIIEEFKSKIVTCNKCRKKVKVRCYKNGRLDISTVIK